jgi:hypothetical protein
MNAADSQRLLQHIRRLAGDPSGQLSDGELLRRYLAAREETAFATLMRRHGPMVFSVCQSVLRQRADAEDAFQAAFLILAQKAGSVRRHEGLGGWLQRVAYRRERTTSAANSARRGRRATPRTNHPAMSFPGASCGLSYIRSWRRCRNRYALHWCCAISKDGRKRKRRGNWVGLYPP